MFTLPLPLVVSATVNFALAPLRRIRLLMAVQDDLADEGVIPNDKGIGNCGGFGGAIGCARFLYQMGGARAFYRGALLEYSGVVVKYLIQVAVVVPICRRVPLQMQRSYMLTTLFHTCILFLPVAPIQLLIDTVVVNACSDFVRKDAPREPTCSIPTPAPPATEVDGSKFRYRFASLWEAAKAAGKTLPIVPLVNKLMLLDFAGRYISSLVFNKALGYLYEKILDDSGTGTKSNGGNNSKTATMWLLRVVPALVSVAYGLLTYPTVSLPFTHFTRVRLHERLAAEAAAAEDEERAYRFTSPSPERHTTSTTENNASSFGAQPKKSNNASTASYPSNKSFGGSRSQRLAGTLNCDDDAEELWIDRVVDVFCHFDVRDYLYFTYEQWGMRGLYRGYGVQIATILLGVGCGGTLTSILTQLQRGLRHGLHHGVAPAAVH